MQGSRLKYVHPKVFGLAATPSMLNCRVSDKF